MTLLKMLDFLRRLRGKITGLNVISTRFDVQQKQLDYLLSIAGKSDQGGLASPFVEDQSIDPSPYSGATNLRHFSLMKISPGEKIRIVFLVVTPEIWPSIQPVWELATKDDRFYVSVVVLKSANPDMALMSFSKAQRMLESAGISYFTEQTFSLDTYRPHVVFYPLPYASLYPHAYKPDIVASKGCRIAYVPYGLEVGGGVFNARYQYDSEVPRVAWRVFARSKGQQTSFGRYCSYGNGHVLVTGHPRVEMDDHHEIRVHHVAKSKAKGRSVILWTPHFTVVTRRKWSSFLDYYETILRLFDDRPDLFVLVRPHPFLRTSLAKLEDWGPERVAAWFRAIDERDNVHVDTETDYQPAFEISTALLADAGSFLVEYLQTGKPICHLSGKDDIGLSDEVRGLDCFYPGATEINISVFLDRLRNGEDSMFEARKAARLTYFGPDDQSPSKSILDEVANHIDDLPARIFSVALPISSSHEEAFQYWVKATTTFLAPENYYQEQEKKLQDILSRHAIGQFAADIGCGNGRFTQIFSKYFEFVEAADPNELLIREAREDAIQKGIANISYSVERLEHAESLCTYDFVSCMGVTSGLVDDEVFIKSIWKLKAAMRPGAKLLLKETLSLSTSELIEWNGYTAVYRNRDAYLYAFEAAGLSLVEELVIARDLEKFRVNSFFVFLASASENA
jgi:SAM-dependent methyltransferase